jgi:hypothetical protein
MNLIECAAHSSDLGIFSKSSALSITLDIRLLFNLVVPLVKEKELGCSKKALLNTRINQF